MKQIRSANLLQRLDKYHFDVEGLTNVEKKAKSTVFFSNHSQTSVLPQLTSPSLTSKTLHQTSPSEVISPVHVDKRFPSCCAWIMPVTTDQLLYLYSYLNIHLLTFCNIQLFT